MAKVVLFVVLLLQILIRQGLGDDSVYGETASISKNEYNDLHPVYNTPVSMVESSAIETTIRNEVDKDNMKESNKHTSETNIGLAADEQIKRIQQASETISSVIQSEFDNLAKMIQTPEKRSKRETTSLPTTKYFAKFLNYFRSHNDQQNGIRNKNISGKEISEKLGIEQMSNPVIKSNEVESDLNVQASENAERTTEMPIEQAAKPTLETTTELPNVVYPETTPVPYKTVGENYYFYDTSTEPTPLESLENTTEQQQINDNIHQDPIQGTSERPNSFFPQTVHEYPTPAYPEQNMPYVVPVREQIFYMMHPQEPTVFTDEVENILDTDFSTEKGEEPRVSHQTYSTMHRMSQMPATAYYHAMPQQRQYYFYLA